MASDTLTMSEKWFEQFVIILNNKWYYNIQYYNIIINNIIY